MIARIVNFSVARRWHVLIATILLSILGALALTRLPIDVTCPKDTEASQSMPR